MLPSSWTYAVNKSCEPARFLQASSSAVVFVSAKRVWCGSVNFIAVTLVLLFLQLDLCSRAHNRVCDKLINYRPIFTAEAILTCLFSRVSGVSMTASVTPAMVLAVCFHNNSSINYSTFSRLSPTTFRQDYRSCCQSSTTDQGPVQQVGRLQNNFHGSVRCISHGNTCTR